MLAQQVYGQLDPIFWTALHPNFIIKTTKSPSAFGSLSHKTNKSIKNLHY